MKSAKFTGREADVSVEMPCILKFGQLKLHITRNTWERLLEILLSHPDAAHPEKTKKPTFLIFRTKETFQKFHNRRPLTLRTESGHMPILSQSLERGMGLVGLS